MSVRFSISPIAKSDALSTDYETKVADIHGWVREGTCNNQSKMCNHIYDSIVYHAHFILGQIHLRTHKFIIQKGVKKEGTGRCTTKTQTERARKLSTTHTQLYYCSLHSLPLCLFVLVPKSRHCRGVQNCGDLCTFTLLYFTFCKCFDHLLPALEHKQMLNIRYAAK